MKILCHVTDTGLVPKYESDWEEYCKLKRESDIVIETTKERNYEFHKKFFALIKLAFDNLPEHLHDELNVYTPEDLRVRLKIDLNLFKLVRYGNMQAIALDSISFKAMDEFQFNSFYNKCLNHILNVYLKGVSPHQVSEELYRFL